jgi:hypothetical protein
MSKSTLITFGTAALALATILAVAFLSHESLNAKISVNLLIGALALAIVVLVLKKRACR